MNASDTSWGRWCRLRGLRARLGLEAVVASLSIDLAPKKHCKGSTRCEREKNTLTCQNFYRGNAGKHQETKCARDAKMFSLSLSRLFRFPHLTHLLQMTPLPSHRIFLMVHRSHDLRSFDGGFMKLDSRKGIESGGKLSASPPPPPSLNVRRSGVLAVVGMDSPKLGTALIGSTASCNSCDINSRLRPWEGDFSGSSSACSAPAELGLVSTVKGNG